MNKKISKNFFIRLSVIFLTFLIVLTSIININKIDVRAYDDYNDFDETNVLDDLESSSEFKIDDFPFDSTGNVKKCTVINVVEWAYGVRDKSDFALYVYFYNPQAYLINEESAKNKIQIATQYNTEIINKTSDATSYEQFNLLFINKSERANYEGLFYKFRVIDKTDSFGKKVLADRVYTNERRYDISGITLSTKNEDKEFAVANTYYFSGYASGYGADESADSTLTGYCETFETISLNVKSGFYRPKGYSTDITTRDQLHFVYFAVPNDYIRKYGEMVAVHATWLNAVLKPMLVTGNQEAYNAILPFLGETIYNTTMSEIGEIRTYDKLNYRYAGTYLKWPATSVFGISGMLTALITGEWAILSGGPYFNFPASTPDAPTMDKLCLMFNSGDSQDSADTYKVSQSELLTAMQNYSRNRVKDVNSTFSSDLFKSVDSAFTEVNFTNDKEYVNGEYKEYSLTSTKITQNNWQKFWGTYSEKATETFEGIRCIQAVDELTYNASRDCEKYFIDESCYTDFQRYYEDNKSANTIYIFRYKASEYYSKGLTLLEGENIENLRKVDSNAYAFQQEIDIGFDIIDITFKSNNNYYVVPVVSNPMDIVFPSDAPLVTKTDKSLVQSLKSSVDSIFDKIGNKLSSVLNKLGKVAVIVLGVVFGVFFIYIWYNLFVKNISNIKNTFIKILFILITLIVLAGIVYCGFWLYGIVSAMG